MRLDGKVAWITGAAHGIGRATALRFAQEGAGLVLGDLEESALDEVAGEIRQGGGRAAIAVGDVTRREDVQRMSEAALSEFGRLDILINNAGINRDGLAVKVKDGQAQLMGDEMWDPVLAVNLKGAFLCAQAAAVQMIEKGEGGRVVNTSSIGALGNIGQANYAASKAGGIGLTKTLALEYAKYAVTVNCVAPGATMTAMLVGVPDKIKEQIIAKIPMA